MIFSRTTRYAINTLVYLAKQPKEDRCGVFQIAGAISIPQHYLGKILQDLRKRNIVESSRGRKGGFRLSRAPEEIGLYDVVAGIEDMQHYTMCIFDDQECLAERPCSAVCEWNQVKNCITGFLKNHSLSDLQEVWQPRDEFGFRNNL